MTNPNFQERFFESMKLSKKKEKAGSLDELEERIDG